MSKESGKNMSKSYTKRSKILSEFDENEEKPKRVGLFRHSFIEVARTLAAAGIKSDSELALRFHVSNNAIHAWRKKYPRFQQAIDGGLVELIEEMTGRAVAIAREGSERMVTYLLDRRAPGFAPSSRMEHSGSIASGETLGEHLARRAQNIDELLESGKLRMIDSEDQG